MNKYSENDLQRFIEAQNNSICGYAQAWAEIDSGRKTSHWIWYIFPQLRSLGFSNMASYYGITDRDEAKRYLENETLNERIREISKTLLKHKGKSAVEILGRVDAKKVRSCMTMFDCISPNDIFDKVLEAFYDGERCHRTVAEMNKNNERRGIKVVGVGAGGWYAVEHICEKGMENVSFAVCCNESFGAPVGYVKERLNVCGQESCKRPWKARENAEKHIDEIKKMVGDGTRILFVVSGFGGGTGTGVAPLVANIAKEMGVFTVGVVTIPYRFEMIGKINIVTEGIKTMEESVDRLMVIDCEKFAEDPGFVLKDAFKIKDDAIAECVDGMVKMMANYNDLEKYRESFGETL